MIADGLAQNATLRRAVAASAEREIKNYQSSPTPAEAATSPAPAPAPGTAEGAPPAPAPAAPSTADRGTMISSKAIAEIQNLGLPIGWGVAGRQSYIQAFDALDRSRPTDEFKIFGVGMVFIGLHLTMGLGWLMTALAVTLGAPFWFDILNRLVVIRATVKPHEKSREEGSQDHQDKKGVNVSLHAAPAAVIAPATGAAFDDHDPVVDQLNPADRPAKATNTTWRPDHGDHHPRTPEGPRPEHPRRTGADLRRGPGECAEAWRHHQAAARPAFHGPDRP